VDYESEKDFIPLADNYHELRRQRTRSVAVTVFLTLLIVAFSFTVSVNITALTNPDYRAELEQQYPNFPGWYLPFITLCAALNVVWAIALLRWQKWAFYAMLLTCGAMVVCFFLVERNLGADSISTIAAMLILFVLLKIGGPRSTWMQLQ
jgi:hypothetical protein